MCNAIQDFIAASFLGNVIKQTLYYTSETWNIT